MSCGTHNGSINETFIIETVYTSGNTNILSACTGFYTDTVVSCSGDAAIVLSSGETLFNTSIVPQIDATIDLGTLSKRFRNINTVSGSSTVWTTTSLNTGNVNLGNDSQGNSRIITADNSILVNDELFGGTY